MLNGVSPPFLYPYPILYLPLPHILFTLTPLLFTLTPPFIYPYPTFIYPGTRADGKTGKYLALPIGSAKVLHFQDTRNPEIEKSSGKCASPPFIYPYPTSYLPLPHAKCNGRYSVFIYKSPRGPINCPRDPVNDA